MGGPKKTISTRHQFCSNPNCEYYLIIDENIHALVEYGSPSKYEHIQDLFCQACKKKITIRRRTLILSSFFYAQVIKQLRRFRLISVEHRFLWGHPDEYRARLKANGLSGNINTSFVECANPLAPSARAGVTIRQSVSKLTRRTWGPAQYTSELEDHLYAWLVYYHFVRPHESLRIRLDEPILRKGKQHPKLYKKVTPAMDAQITSRQWSMS